ncbi:hypothetical protein ACFSCX_15885 [Bacillus salitolerans]|uniref:Uncharacterized protein n=1 Tax=Bacillus salitolerans TaxID=1437434 RepID=A0ABW4LSG6_9BACI
MTLDKIGKWFGVLIILAGFTRMGMTPTSLIWGTDSTQELIFGFAACILMAASSIGLFLVQRESGALGFVSTIAIIVFNAITGCMVWMLLASGMTGEEALRANANSFILVSKIIVMAGMFLGMPGFAYATFRAKVFPRWIIYLLLLSFIVPMLPLMEKWGAFFWGLSYVGMGYVMLTEKYAKSQTIKSDYLPV